MKKKNFATLVAAIACMTTLILSSCYKETRFEELVNKTTEVYAVDDRVYKVTYVSQKMVISKWTREDSLIDVWSTRYSNIITASIEDAEDSVFTYLGEINYDEPFEDAFWVTKEKEHRWASQTGKNELRREITEIEFCDPQTGWKYEKKYSPEPEVVYPTEKLALP